MIKKIVPVFIIAVYCIACSNDDKKDETDSSVTETPATSTEKPEISLVTQADYDAGLALIAKSDCLTCHKIEEKLIGPSYRDVANKYPVDTATISYLAGKIITGGSGVWGQVAMTPHPLISQEDARTMAKYVLYLKK